MGKIQRNVGTPTAYAYADAPLTEYAGGGNAIRKQVLVGPQDHAPNIALRYFEVPPGSSTAYDQHAHEHGVVVVRGAGRVMLSGAEHDLKVGDVVYVEPNEIHQFHCAGDEPFGFMCIIDVRQEK